MAVTVDMAVTVAVTGKEMRMAEKRAQRTTVQGTPNQADTNTENLKEQLKC